MQNFYKLLNLKPSADIYKIQAALKKTKKRLPAVMMRKKAAVLPFRAATAAAATLKPLF